MRALRPAAALVAALLFLTPLVLRFPRVYLSLMLRDGAAGTVPTRG
jgi:hypothetical protein